MSQKLLVIGYIRELEKSALNAIVPSDIKSLCIEYYYSNSKLLLIQNEEYIGSEKEKGILIIDFNEDEEATNNTVWNARLSALPNAYLIPPKYAKPWIIEDAAICCYSNITLPDYILSATNLPGNHNNNVIFKCGQANSNYAIIINDSDFGSIDDKESLKPYCWELPSFGVNRRSNALLYSKWYGLLSIGGIKGSKNCDEILQLSFNTMEWKCIGKMETKFRNTSCIMINDRTLFVCGGTKASNSDSKEVSIYDFELKEWIPLRQSKYARSKMGVYFDKIDKRVFCVGGNESNFPVNKAEYYDLERNEWFRIPNTSLKHGWNPCVWKHPNNKNILLIASYTTNSIEMYDLRDCAAMRAQYTKQYSSGWSTIYSTHNNWPMYQSSLQDLFETTFVKYGLSKCNERIIRFNDDYF